MLTHRKRLPQHQFNSTYETAPTMKELYPYVQSFFVLCNLLSVLFTMRGKIIGWLVLFPGHILIAIYFGVTGQYIMILGNVVMLSAGTYGIYRFRRHGVHRDADAGAHAAA
jgi:ABC-type long-subunit fatty acid transport system fused permease/ATPase subunit